MEKVVVHDDIQEGYQYALIAPMGKRFDPEFKPELTPKQMLELGVFGGSYLNDCHDEFPKEWFVLEKEGAQLQLAPVEGTFNGLIITQGGSYVPLLYGTKDSWPHMFEVTYTAGFCNDQIPVILNEMIGLQAAISMFMILRDTIYGPLAGENTSIDGAATGRQLGPTGPYGARIEAYQKKLDELLKVAHKYYNGFAFTVP